MSATNRGGAERHPDDFYRTPDWCVDAILPHVSPSPGSYSLVLDPCAGDGAILNRVWEASKCSVLTYGFEIDQQRAHEADVYCDDALLLDSWAVPPEQAVRPDLIITNPPYKLALSFVERAIREVSPAGQVAMLLRLGFLSSAKRRGFHKAHPADVYVLTKRPSFTGNGSTDASDYGWFVWGAGVEGRIRVL